MDGLQVRSGDADDAGLAVDDVAMLVVVGSATALALSLGWAYGFSRRCRAWFGVAAAAAAS